MPHSLLCIIRKNQSYPSGQGNHAVATAAIPATTTTLHAAGIILPLKNWTPENCDSSEETYATFLHHIHQYYDQPEGTDDWTSYPDEAFDNID